ncbi:transporter substrate-binding domain-containing protein (plasmid) [Chromobacterium amazonense]|uniref:substrate-binding periplasmic protein n=1 Tax=Chromobacterium amazonense TaxID=1382803 RepID=UPI00237D7D3D|nr:transporter substrate-binding domain-containing protein [Chromobacterium amazonense]MDE1713754.1 transporter substrate-binding domain-containing protein [Chromobacterium amazonense]
MWRGLLLAGWSALVFAASDTVIVYPASAPGDMRYEDIRELLQTALQQTEDQYGPFRLEPSKWVMEEDRAQTELRRGDVDVIWTSTSEQRERDFLPVRIDLRKGLLGYRIALIDGRRQSAFDAIQAAADLKHWRIGQGKDWRDVEVYRAAGIPLVFGRYQSLFGMLMLGRFDLYPRSVLEVFDEYRRYFRQYPHLAVEQRLVFYYPWPYYFFCNRANPKLAQRLKLGLARMWANGSFDEIFWKYHGEVLRQAALRDRRLISLPNPLLPSDAPLTDKSMWFDPLRDRPPKP